MQVHVGQCFQSVHVLGKHGSKLAREKVGQSFTQLLVEKLQPVPSHSRGLPRPTISTNVACFYFACVVLRQFKDGRLKLAPASHHLSLNFASLRS